MMFMYGIPTAKNTSVIITTATAPITIIEDVLIQSLWENAIPAGTEAPGVNRASCVTTKIIQAIPKIGIPT